MMRRVKEFYLFIGTDDQDSCWRQMFVSSICSRPSWALASPWVEERGDVDVAVAPTEP